MQPPSRLDLDLALCDRPFAPYPLLAQWSGGDWAAEAHFIGRMRGVGERGQDLQALEVEHYPGMTERMLEALAREEAARGGARRILLRHCVGQVAPGEAIVLLAVAAERRGQAIETCRRLLERLKHDAPFWKKEVGPAGQHWVRTNSGYEPSSGPLAPL